MRRVAVLISVSCLSAVIAAAADDSRLVWADFELPLDQRPVSAGGGWIQGFTYQENDTKPARFTGMPNLDPPAPKVVRTSKDNENRAAAFEYDLQAPNRWSGAGVEIYGKPEQDGVPVPQDVSGFKTLTLQVYTAEVVHMRVDFISRQTGRGETFGKRADEVVSPPQFTWRTRPGFNTYKVPLKDVMQPSWAEPKLDVKKVLRKLTSLNVSVYCDDCRAEKGVIVVDNLVFEK